MTMNRSPQGVDPTFFNDFESSLGAPRGAHLAMDPFAKIQPLAASNRSLLIDFYKQHDPSQLMFVDNQLRDFGIPDLARKLFHHYGVAPLFEASLVRDNKPAMLFAAQIPDKLFAAQMPDKLFAAQIPSSPTLLMQPPTASSPYGSIPPPGWAEQFAKLQDKEMVMNALRWTFGSSLHDALELATPEAKHQKRGGVSPTTVARGSKVVRLATWPVDKGDDASKGDDAAGEGAEMWEDVRVDGEEVKGDVDDDDDDGHATVKAAIVIQGRMRQARARKEVRRRRHSRTNRAAPKQIERKKGGGSSSTKKGGSSSTKKGGSSSTKKGGSSSTKKEMSQLLKVRFENTPALVEVEPTVARCIQGKITFAVPSTVFLKGEWAPSAVIVPDLYTYLLSFILSFFLSFFLGCT
jgi:hypothetical protein